jgi:hypothetical protein
MDNEQTGNDLLRQRASVRRRALGNLILLLTDQAHRSTGRFGITPFQQDAIGLEYHDVRTLVRRGDGRLDIATRDFAIVLVCPALWPFDRRAALAPFVLSPDDFAHPNSDGRGICVDLAGVLPERLPALVYDNLRLERCRLDHPVDHAVASFVRAHGSLFPADSRRLYPVGEDLQ